MDSTAQEASISLIKKLEQLSKENAECTIYRVHRELRSVNPKAYEPDVIAIGPYHRDKPHLKMMEDHKLRNLQSLITEGRCNVETCAATLGKLESQARKCYADQPSISHLSSSELVQMLLLDGCFIIELVRKHYYGFSREEDDSIFRMDWMIGSLERDLMLFENQLPFFVLYELFELVNDPNHLSGLDLLLSFLSGFFDNLYPGKRRIELEVNPGDEIKHLLDLIHRCWVPHQNSRDNQENGLELVNINATGLREANVKFKKKEEAAATLFDIEFKDGVLLMPPLSIQDTTECVLRNLVLYEQYFKHTPHNFVTDYIVFLDCLINSPKDVELLSRNGILINLLGDEEVVAKMVNRLCDSIVRSTNDLYGGIAKDLNEHCRKPRNRWMAKLRRNYLNSPWAIISIIVAILLLLLTVTQSVFSILQVVS